MIDDVEQGHLLDMYTGVCMTSQLHEARSAKNSQCWLSSHPHLDVLRRLNEMRRVIGNPWHYVPCPCRVGLTPNRRCERVGVGTMED